MNDKEQASNSPTTYLPVMSATGQRKGTWKMRQKKMVTKRSFSAVRPPHVMTNGHATVIASSTIFMKNVQKTGRV